MTTERSADEVWHALLHGEFGWKEERRRFRLLRGRSNPIDVYVLRVTQEENEAARN